MVGSKLKQTVGLHHKIPDGYLYLFNSYIEVNVVCLIENCMISTNLDNL